MGTVYKQLSLEDRCEIARLHQDGRSIREIAALSANRETLRRFIAALWATINSEWK